MTEFIIHRFLIMIPVMLLVGIICFLLIHIVPGNPAELMLGPEADISQIEALTERMGYDKPLYVQFALWFSSIIQGNFGSSIYSNKPVLGLIGHRMEPSLLIAIFGTGLYAVLGILVGVISAVKQNTWLDQLVMTSSLTLASIPSFCIGLVLMLVFASILRWMPSCGYPGVFATGNLANLKYLVLPVLAVTLPSTGFIARLTRSYVLDIISTEYITTARAKGVKESIVIMKHVLRNALIPVIAILGTSFAGLISFTVVTETIFNIPGIGRLVVESISQRDYPTLQAVLMFVAGIYLVVNFLCDVAYAIVDPRIQYS